MTTLDDMRKKGGTPEEFKKACGDALVQGFITLDEAEAASEKYRMEWDLVQVRSEARRLRVENERLSDGFSTLAARCAGLEKENAELKVCLEGANQVVLSSAREAESLAAKVEALQSARERDGSEMRETLKFEADLQAKIAQVRLRCGEGKKP